MPESGAELHHSTIPSGTLAFQCLSVTVTHFTEEVTILLLPKRQEQGPIGVSFSLLCPHYEGGCVTERAQRCRLKKPGPQEAGPGL